MSTQRKAPARKSTGRATPKKPGKLVLDINSLDLGEVRDIQEATGKQLEDLLVKNKASFDLVIGMLWVYKRRTNPSFTFENALRTKVVELENIEVVADKNPTRPGVAS